MRKKITLSLAFILFTFFGFKNSLQAQAFNNSQILPSNHWIYSNLKTLAMSQKITFFNENSMMTIAEIKFYFEQIDYDKLDGVLYDIYEQTSEFLYGKKVLLNLSPFLFDFRIKLNPEFYYKSNDDIPWTFNYFYKDNLATFPLKFGFADYVTIQTDPFVGKSHYGSSRNDSFTNFPYRNGDIEYILPRFAYGSTAYMFDNWGVNFHIGKEGFQIGDSKIGSVIYNHTFETDAYANLNLFSKYFKYSMDIIQISGGSGDSGREKWFYIHQFTIRPHNTFKFSALEGSMLNAPFELRYLNPLMVMHQFSSWTEYDKGPGYTENHFCAYLAGLIDWQPIQNFRLYALYAQNELQLPTERDKTGKLYPDSLGGQLGFEFIVPGEDGIFNAYTEAMYTTPYLYIKQNPESSLYRTRGDNLITDEVNTWIGSPYGPDSFGIKTGFGYQKPQKYTFDLSYLFLAKGEHDFSIFHSKTNEDGKYVYYPREKYKEFKDGELDPDDSNYNEILNDARWMWLCGTPYFLNTISAEGNVIVNSKTSLDLKCAYTFIFNNYHIGGKFSHGVEIDFSLTYNLL